MQETSHDRAPLGHGRAARPARRRPRPALLARAGGTDRATGLAQPPAGGLSATGAIGADARPPRLPQAARRLARAGRPGRLQPPAAGRNRAVGAPARPVAAGVAALLRQHAGLRGRRRRRAGGNPSGAADQDRGQSGASDEPGRHLGGDAGGGAGAVGSGPLAGADARRRRLHLGRLRGRGPHACRAFRPRRPRAARAQRPARLAHAGGATRRLARALSRLPLARVRSGRRGQRAGRRATGLRSSAAHAPPLRPRAGDPVAGGRLPRHDAGQPAPRPRLHRRPRSGVERLQPPLCGRGLANTHRCQGRPSLAAGQCAGRPLRARAGGTDWPARRARRTVQRSRTAPPARAGAGSRWRARQRAGACRSQPAAVGARPRAPDERHAGQRRPHRRVLRAGRALDRCAS